VLREYLRFETIAPLPLLRLATAHPDTVDAVFRRSFSMIGARLSELGARGR